MNDVKLSILCKQNGFENPEQIKEIIKMTFVHKFFRCYPKAVRIEKALYVLRQYLGTQDVNEMIKWATKK